MRFDRFTYYTLVFVLLLFSRAGARPAPVCKAPAVKAGFCAGRAARVISCLPGHALPAAHFDGDCLPGNLFNTNNPSGASFQARGKSLTILVWCCAAWCCIALQKTYGRYRFRYGYFVIPIRQKLIFPKHWFW